MKMLVLYPSQTSLALSERFLSDGTLVSQGEIRTRTLDPRWAGQLVSPPVVQACSY